MKLCRVQISSHPKDPRAYYLCGQAHFALTYLHATRGNYYRTGTNGSDTIEYLERALTLTPELVDAKMHLGTAYYFADNLPPYLKAFSRFLWFIPTGDSAKSLPYLEEVTLSEGQFSDVAKYTYSTLLLEGDSRARRQAGVILADLAKRYPESRRFQLRHISHLVEETEYAQALIAIEKFISPAPCCRRNPVDIQLARLWKARAYLGLDELQCAASEMARIPDTMVAAFPLWGRGWYSLTAGQINDVLQKRKKALREYHRVLALTDEGRLSKTLGDAATLGIKTSFTIDRITP